MTSLSKHILVVVSISVLAGCASTKEAVLPQDGPSMKTIYEQHIQSIAHDDPLVLRNALGTRSADSDNDKATGIIRDAESRIDSRFLRLPNPTLVMYVFPHLAGLVRVPVPGYFTRFPMYERIEYALPGEVPSRTGQ